MIILKQPYMEIVGIEPFKRLIYLIPKRANYESKETSSEKDNSENRIKENADEVGQENDC